MCDIAQLESVFRKIVLNAKVASPRENLCAAQVRAAGFCMGRSPFGVSTILLLHMLLHIMVYRDRTIPPCISVLLFKTSMRRGITAAKGREEDLTYCPKTRVSLGVEGCMLYIHHTDIRYEVHRLYMTNFISKS